MNFDDFVGNLSSTLAVKKQEPFYDLHLHKHSDMQPHQRDAHIRSMLYSQKHEYKADIRLVLDEEDPITPGADPWKVESYITPSLALARDVAAEVVIRRDGREFVAKSRDGTRPLGFQ